MSARILDLITVEMMKMNKSKGMKYDTGKPRMDLVLHGFPHSLRTLGVILGFGAEKYAADSWKSVPHGVARYEAAALRHWLAHVEGEVLDPESGQPHLAHTICNLLFVMELIKDGNEYDPNY